MQPDRPLRVGIALDAGAVRRWHATAVSEIERLGFCRLTVFVCEPGRSTIRRRLRRAARHALYEGYLLADRRLFGGDDDALARVSIEGCGGEGTRRIRLAGGWSSAPTVATITAEDLDVLLCLGPDVPAGRLAGCARFGAWSLHADGLWGPDADLVAPVTLRAHTSVDSERTIYRSVVESDRISLHRGRCRAARRAAHLAPRRLRDLQRHGWPFISSPGVDAERHSTPGPDPLPPSNGMMVRFLWRVARGVLSRRVAGRLGEKQWFIAYRRVGGDGHAATDPAPLTVIAPPPGRFYADPFLFRRDGRRFIFFEDYDWSSGRAAIRYVEIDEGGRHSSPQLALKQDCHLSYPFVFEDGGAVYMVPETGGRRTRRALAGDALPGRLDPRSSAAERRLGHRRHPGPPRREAVAVRGHRRRRESGDRRALPVLLRRPPGRVGTASDEPRRLRRAPRASRREGLLAERPPHQAGAGLLPFLRGRLVFNRIESLSPLEYRETTVGALEPAPDSGNLRTHSYDSDGTYEVLDGFRMRPRFSVRGISPSPTRPRWHRVDLESPGRERSVLHS